MTGTIGNANYLGAYLLFPLFALAGLIFLLKGKLRLLPVGLFIFVFGVFLFTRARASWLGLVISFPIFMVLIKGIYNFSVPGYIRSNPRRVMGYGILILFLVALLWSISPQRFHSMMDIKELSNPKTLEMRMKHYQASWWLFKQSPLFGTGLWSYSNRVYDAQAEINREDPEFFKDYVDCKPRRVHNEYLEILNDGGLVASAFLLIFFIAVMSHGRRVIQDEKVQTSERVITATAFASMIGIMVAAVLFFPFRINSTLFMTVLMMGIMEGIYLRNYGLVTRTEGRRFAFAYLVIPLIFLVLMGIFWFGGYRPFKGELEFFQYREAFARRDAKQAEKHILKAISCDPDNSLYCYNAGQLYMNILRDYVKAGDFLERVVIDFNGDLTRWSVYFMKGLLKFRMGSLFEARDAFEKSLYYNPNFSPAREKLKEVKKVLKDHDSVLIKLR